MRACTRPLSYRRRKQASRRYACFFISHSWKPSLLIDASIRSRFRLWGGTDSGRITPTACQGRNCAGNLWPPWSSENARKFGLVSDLKIKMRMGAFLGSSCAVIKKPGAGPGLHLCLVAQPTFAAAGRPACRCSASDRLGSAAAEREQAMLASRIHWMKLDSS